MKKIILILVILFPLKLFAPTMNYISIPISEGINPYENLWEAICAIESNKRPYVINLKDPRGGSWGIAQIGQLKLDSYNKVKNTSYTLSDLFDVELSKKIFMWHCLQYNLDYEIIAKRWNGSGPLTVIYWGKVSNVLNRNGIQS